MHHKILKIGEEDILKFRPNIDVGM